MYILSISSKSDGEVATPPQSTVCDLLTRLLLMDALILYSSMCSVVCEQHYISGVVFQHIHMIIDIIVDGPHLHCYYMYTVTYLRVTITSSIANEHDSYQIQ